MPAPAGAPLSFPPGSVSPWMYRSELPGLRLPPPLIPVPAIRCAGPGHWPRSTGPSARRSVRRGSPQVPGNRLCAPGPKAMTRLHRRRAFAWLRRRRARPPPAARSTWPMPASGISNYSWGGSLGPFDGFALDIDYIDSGGEVRQQPRIGLQQTEARRKRFDGRVQHRGRNRTDKLELSVERGGRICVERHFRTGPRDQPRAIGLIHQGVDHHLRRVEDAQQGAARINLIAFLRWTHGTGAIDIFECDHSWNGCLDQHPFQVTLHPGEANLLTVALQFEHAQRGRFRLLAQCQRFSQAFDTFLRGIAPRLGL